MDIESLEEALSEILPEGFEIVFDQRRQVIIRTGLVEDSYGELHHDGGASLDLSYEDEEEDLDLIDQLSDEDI